jgi:prepilin-type N-terminal cleavage/methylation domain-containing protein
MKFLERFFLMRRNNRGFTLIELLVVIAIIALLMSILMPALRNVRDQAKNSMCMQRLQQWAVMFNMYANENDGGMMDWGEYTWAGGMLIEHAWVRMMYDYAESFEIYLCPAATHSWQEGMDLYGPKAAWDFQYIIAVDGETSFWEDWVWLYAAGTKEDPIYSYGSYGKNVLISTNPIPMWNKGAEDTSWFWQNVRVKGGSRIPLFGDCSHMGGLPMIYDEPAPTRFHHVWDESGAVNLWNQDRHHLSVNLVFLDWSVRKVGLRQLWSLNWTRQKTESGAGWGDLEIVPDWNKPEQWPEWMQMSKNYDL